MRSLSLKVVAWFAALLFISFVASLAVTAIVVAKDGGGYRLMNSMLRLQADGAAAAFESGSRAALVAYLEKLDRQFFGRHYLADRSGRDLLSGKAHRLVESRTTPLLPPFLVGGRPSTVNGRSTDGQHVMVVEANGDSFDRSNVFPYFFTIVVVVLLTCYVLALSLVRPLIEMRKTMSRFGGGDLSARTRSTRRDEFGDVGRAFDAMADRLQTLLDAERRLLQDISHELNSPLARLTFAVELARTAPDRNVALDRAKKEALRISEMAQELIQITRVEGDSDARSTEDVQMTELLLDISEDYTFEADAKHCRVLCRIEEELSIQGDSVLLRRGIENVVRNALKYAPEETKVELRARRVNSFAEISIRDFGPGVPSQHLNDIFRPFFRVENDRSRSSGGVGLGLAIAQRVVHLHCGQIEAENAHPGLRVSLRIPVALKKS